MCGENFISRKAPRAASGSSPRVRGKRRLIDTHRLPRGLIPACAGKTIYDATARLFTGAHPRVCGENIASSFGVNCESGSSPRVRGKRHSRVKQFACLGLIPACAGKTVYFTLDRRAAKAHPRVCGENYPMLRPFMKAAGSSPRVRGKHVHYRRPRRSHGLIPACAGKTRLFQCR